MHHYKYISFGQLDKELKFSFSRSSGPGGQSVNKLNTKAELRFSIRESELLLEEHKQIILEKLSRFINQEGEFILVSQASRSQLQNKEIAIEKFYELINKVLTPRKRRLKTKATRASKERRLQAKKQQGEKKSRRKWND